MVKRYAELVVNRLEVRIKSRTITTLKTPQSIGAANELLKEGIISKILVVPPASLKYQWQSEINKFTGLDSIVVDGTAKKRKNQYDTFATTDIPFMIVNYETVRNDIDIIKELGFGCVISDESHRIKSRKTKLYKAMMQLEADYKFALTGTPMQNRPDEIYALMSWLDPEVLGKITAFRKEHIVIGEKFGRRFIELGYKNLDIIREKISPKMLRRMKEDVAPDLPERIEVTVRADMTKPQKALYETIVEDFKLTQLTIQEFYESQSEEDARSGKKADEEDKVLGYLYMMQAVSNHPLLLAQGKSKMAKKYLPLIRECRTSPKMDELMETLVPILEKGSKVVIFSQYARMVQILHDKILELFNQDAYMIHGGIKAKERQEQLEDFEKSFDRQVMLLTDAGNYG